ncbi:trifunctional NAD biosynthesis/regulator protein NadR [Filimonas sp.]|jgi:hypothetical protein|nr:trifunctional NAD biosynthesis/regulator protein NadR [Filimonas sp.]
MNTVKKIVVLGGESTGKSTLCEQLAHQYNTVWVREFARTYLEHLGRDYVQDDLLTIAEGQIASEEEQVKKACDFLFCDTDLHVIKVWSEYKYSHVDEVIQEIIQSRSYDAYILTSPDFPWQEDPLREHPEPALRSYFFNLYHALIRKTGLPYCIVKGNEEDRMKTATTWIDSLYPI